MKSMETADIVRKEDVFRLLEGFGIRHDDYVTIHSSLRAVGPIEGGAEGLLDALRAYLAEGLLLIPTHTWADIGTRLSYDPRKDVPCVGVLSRIAAFHPDGVRSLHPTHSVTAFGKNAAAYVSLERTYDTPTAPDNCVSRLCGVKGKILLVGVGLESCTYLHSVDEMLHIPNRIAQDTIPIRVTGYDDRVTTVNLHPFKVEGLGCGISEYYPNYEKPLSDTGALTCGKLGNARVMCCDAYKTFETVRRLWERADHDLCFGEQEIPEKYYR